MIKKAHTIVWGLLVFCFCVGLTWSNAQDWPAWRGPDHTGASAVENLPERFGPEENLAWVADLPGDGASTPVIYGNAVLVSAEDAAGNLWAACYDAATGAERWKKNVGQGGGSKLKVTKAAPSPITDGQNAWFLYATGLLVASDMEGTERWRRDIEKDYGRFELLFDYGSSPLLFDGRLYIPVIHGDSKTVPNDKSYVLSLDAATGETLWKHERTTPTTHESKQAYTTPYPMEIGGKTQIMVLGADHFTAHDPKTGKELWRSESYNAKHSRSFRIVPSPASIGNMLIAAAPRASQIFAIDTSKITQGDLQPFAWSIPDAGADVISPLAYRDKLYVLDGRKRKILCIAPETGNVLGETQIENTAIYDASPTAADGKIFIFDKRGTLLVFSAEDTPKELHRVELNGRNCRSSVAIAGGKIFVRVNEKLYCFGEK